jgi:L-lactate dehydrogenase complex protein LldE
MPPEHAPTRLRVGLFVTCLADLFRPSVAFAAVRLLEDAGCEVHVPGAQICCGQPAWNSGDARDARALARQVIAAFEPFDYVVGPSGSCLGMIREHYPVLFPTDATWRGRAQAVAERSHELFSFLTDVLGREAVTARFPGTVTYHDSCSGLRELGVRAQPRRLLASVSGLELREMADRDTCCGFGGTFCVKYPEISERMVGDKVRRITESGAGVVLGGDLGCLLNIAGRLRREGSPVRVYHAAEVLAGLADGPGIGDPAGAGGD